MEDENDDQQEYNDNREPSKEKSPGFRQIGRLIRANWPKYLVEIFVIIIGISLSFIIDSYKDGIRDDALEGIYIKNLSSDIEKDILNLNDVINKSKPVINSANNLLKLLAKKDNRIDENQFSNDFVTMLARSNFISSNATFLDLRSGNIYVIRDPDLRSLLFSYYAYLETIAMDQKTEGEMAINVLQPYLYHNFGMSGFNFDKKDEVKYLPNGNDWAIIHENMFTNVVATRRGGREYLISTYENALVLARKVKGNLEKKI